MKDLIDKTNAVKGPTKLKSYKITFKKVTYRKCKITVKTPKPEVALRPK